MKNSNKNWEEQMKQILDEQEIVFEETDWKAAQALIQAANLHVPTEKKRRKGLGWFWAVLLGGILFGYMIGSGHFTTNKVAAKNESFSQSKTTQKIEKENKTEVSDLALAKKSAPSAKAEVPIKQSKVSPIQTTQKTEKESKIAVDALALAKESAPSAKAEAPIIPPIQTTKTAESVNIIPFTETNQAAIFAENSAKEAEKQDAFMAQTGTILDNKQVKIVPERNINSLQKLTLPQNNLAQNTDKTLKISLLENEKTSPFFSKISANVYAGAAYSQRPYINSTFYGGINMSYSFSPKWKLNLFANYSERKVNFTTPNVFTLSGNGFNNTSTDTVPDYTNTTIPPDITLGSQVVTVEQIYLRAARYVGGGVGLSFQQKKHTFFANASYHYLLNTKSKYDVNITENQSIIYQDTKNISNFVAGINKGDITVGLGYQYALTRKIGLQIALNKGLKDMSNDGFYQNEIKHRNFQVQTGISYRLF